MMFFRKGRMYVFVFDDMVLFTEIRKKKYFIKHYVPLDAESVTVAQGFTSLSLPLSLSPLPPSLTLPSQWMMRWLSRSRTW